MLLSVLIPVYNTEKYLMRCINSFINMPLKDYEAILVDDGSKDNSGRLCDELSKKYSQIKVIHQKNKGLVTARSVALEIASGKYVAFIDSDDWVDIDFLPTLLNDLIKNKDIDIAIGKIKKNNEDFLSMPSQILNKETAIKKMINKEGCHWYLWGKVYKKELFNNLKPDANVTIFEDLDRNWPVFIRANKFIFNNKYAYHYFVNTDGMTEKRCDLNISSWRVFKRILYDENSDFIKTKITDYYTQVFFRHTLEMYFIDKVKYKNKIKDYIEEIKDTFLKNQIKQTVISNNDFKKLTSNYNSLIKYYDDIFFKIKNIFKILKETDTQIYIYGTGIIAQYVSEFAKNNNFEPVAYVVSDGQAIKNTFMDKKVYSLSEIKIMPQLAFILALSGKTEENVLKYMQNKFLIKSNQIYKLEFPPIVW